MFTKTKFHQVMTIVIMLTMLFSAIQPMAVSAQDGDEGRRQDPSALEGDGIKRQANAQSGRVSFIGPENGRALSASRALGTFARPQDPARALADRFAPEFGLKDPARDLSEMKAVRSEDGRVTVRYQQEYNGVPVMGGELIVNTNERGDLYSMNGEVSADLALPTAPTIDSAQAAETALQAMAKWYQKAPADDFAASEPELWIYDESLLQPSTRPVELVWRMEVTAKDNAMPVRELVLVNAERGGISLHFNQIDTAWSSLRNAHTLDSSKPVVSTTTSTHTDLGNDDLTAQSSGEFIPNLVGASWYVATTGNDSNSCSSAGSPCATINGAIDKAAAGDTVFVATGTYMEGGVDDVVFIVKNIIVSGGWSADFSAQNGMSVIDGNGIKRGFKIDDAATMVRVDQFIVQNGYGYGGGRIYNRGNLILNNSSIISNTTICSGCASYWGGGVFNAGNLIVNNSTISANTAGASGGGIYNTSVGTLVLNNTTVSNNTGPGGGIYNNGGTVTLRDRIVAKNNAGTVDCGGTIGTAGYNLIGNTSGCSFTPTTGDIVNQDPLLSPLVGLFKYHTLLSGSPAIDAGNPAVPGAVEAMLASP